jgi:hypothetical protein
MTCIALPGAWGVCVMAGEEVTIREMLIEMKGDLALIRRDNERTQDDIRDLRGRANIHSERIGSLEALHNQSVGEKRGFDKAVKAVYALATICGLSGIAAAAKVLIG